MVDENTCEATWEVFLRGCRAARDVVRVMFGTSTRRGHLDLLLRHLPLGMKVSLGISASYIAFFSYLESLLAFSLSSFLGITVFTHVA